MARGDEGFTLVEMLVSLAVLSLAALMIVQGLEAGGQIRGRSRDSVAAVESVEAAQTLLRDRLERLRPITRIDGPDAVADLGGDERAFSFISLPLDAERPALARRYTLLRDDDDDLVLRSSADDGAGAPRETDQVLMRNTRDLEIAYLDPGSGSPPAWRADWFHKAAPPLAIRLRVAFPKGDPRDWPDMIVRPAATVDTLCVLEPDTGACRGRQ